jgi:hypothetical protein
MSVPQFKSREAMAAYAWNYVTRRAKLDGRFNKLKGGPTVWRAVIDDDGGLHVGEVGVDSGHIEIGDVGDMQLALPTRCGDGLYPVTAIKVNGEVHGYFIGVDALEDWIVTEIEGLDKPWPPVAKKSILKPPAKKSILKREAALIEHAMPGGPMQIRASGR